MTDKKINIAIAEALGAKRRDKLPNYCGDLNAMHEAEEVLNKKQQRRYRLTLHPRRCFGDAHTDWPLLHATARHRAKTFLRTIGKWRDA